MATTLHSNDQAPDKDNWDSGGLEHKRQLLTEFVFKNMMINLVGLLRSYGVQTLGVDNGRDAVDLIASGVKFDLIIIEKILPVLNGLDVTVLIKKTSVSCGKMLGVTACSRESERQAFLAAGVDVFIEKPLDPGHLVPIPMELDGE
ncbi:hypothetical protein ERO13_A05G276232v2 [Gossypium hirsutum]|uniref:Response regulatory domain-containing protein n=3 Tax=Gossypium TaxID=3633 RepID=A0A5J5VVF9_GOSBA|nr:hypothetical protein ES319_A05G288300v1 [Gossypium barbadense]KAG4201391.1 hypothetical protein ERO13_A05G276232v2 [Gossypium hirsutum]TYH18778.1 hypothetical protein ES288_A05G300800v1 [Gossypium darwinii]TYI29263.1 hypothetical protein ES332_A05G304400v1 [Gossypium tomentosum]